VHTILKGFVGAALLFSASAASAQDYTWTLSDFHFDKYGVMPGPYADSEFGTTASGNFVLTKDGSDYSLKSYNFFTTLGDAGISAVYDSSVTEATGTDPLIAFDTYIQMGATDEETRFVFNWPANSLIAEMNMNGVGNEVELGGQAAYEFNATDLRFNGTGAEVCIGFGDEEQCRDANSGVLTLTSITNTPEPGTMALLGAGLLGLFAARRRRAA